MSMAATACGPPKATRFPGYAFVANQQGRSVAAVDLSAFTLARQIPLEGNPADLIAPRVYPSIYALTPETGTVHEIGLHTLAVRRRIRLGRSAVSMRLAPDQRMLWVLCREPRVLAGVALDSLQISTRIQLTAEAADLDLAPDGQSAAVASPAHRSVSIVDLIRRVLERPVNISDPRLIRFRSDGREVLVADRGQRAIVIVDAAKRQVIVRLPLPIAPENLCFSSDGGQLFISGAGMDAVAIVYPYRTEVAETILAGRAPGAMAVSSGSNPYLFVANPPSSDVTIIEILTRKVIGTATVGTEPCDITVTPDNQYALVLNRRSGDMAVIRIPVLGTRRRKAAPLFTMIPVGAQPVRAAVRAI